MGWRIPTLPEVVDAAGCLIYGHDWRDGKCDVCGAER